jgi:hypothetical protein
MDFHKKITIVLADGSICHTPGSRLSPPAG